MISSIDYTVHWIPPVVIVQEKQVIGYAPVEETDAELCARLFLFPPSLILKGSVNNLALSSSVLPSQPRSSVLIGKHSLFSLSPTITLAWWKSNPGPGWESSPKCHKKRNRGCVGSKVELSKEICFFRCFFVSLQDMLFVFSVMCDQRERLTYINKEAYEKSIASHQWCNKKATQSLYEEEKSFLLGSVN